MSNQAPRIELHVDLDRRLGRLAHGLLDPKQFAKAAKNAVSRALKFGKTKTVREIAARYTLPQKEIRKLVWTRMRLTTGYLTSSSLGPPLDKFQHKPRRRYSELKRKPRVGVQVRILKGGAFNAIAGTFMEQGSRGNLHLRRRDVYPGGQRGDIQVRMGPSMGGAFHVLANKIKPEVMRHLNRRMMHNIRHELKRYRR